LTAVCQSVQTVNDVLTQDRTRAQAKRHERGDENRTVRRSSPRGLCGPVEDDGDRLLWRAFHVRAFQAPDATDVAMLVAVGDCSEGPRNLQAFLARLRDRLAQDVPRLE
jgi:hypothetical protein